MVNRGKVLTLFLQDASLNFEKELREMNKGKRGKPYEYPNILIWAGFAIKCVFRQGYRQLQGFMEDVCRSLGTVIPDFRTVWWRIDQMSKQGVRFNVPKGRKIAIAVDSTGLKLVNDGEYRTKKYKKVKDWAKFHTAVNEATGEAVNLVITKDNVGDCREFGKIVEPVARITEKVDTDKAYDTDENFKYCERKGIVPGIPVKLNASPNGVGPRREAVKLQLGLRSGPGQPPRDGHYLSTTEKETNQKEWSDGTGHGYRWVVEGFYSRFKRSFGEYVFSRKRENVEKEVVMKTNLLNLFITQQA